MENLLTRESDRLNKKACGWFYPGGFFLRLMFQPHIQGLVVNYTGNRTIGFCMPQWQEQSCGIFNGQGDVESHSHPWAQGRFLSLVTLGRF